MDMELITKNIVSQNTGCRGSMQMTLEDDINVTDSKPDIDKIIKLKSELRMDSVTPSEDRVILRGELFFSLLYLTNDDLRLVHNMQGQIPFEETMNLDGLLPESDVICHFDLEDCQARLINSRKVSIRALISLRCFQEQQEEISAGTDISVSPADMPGSSAEGLHCLYDEFSLTTLSHQKKDVFRIKDQIVLPKGKPNIETILYYEITTQNLQHRPIEGGIRILGDLKVFILYLPENEERRLEYLDVELPFDNVLTCEECTEDMIPDIELLSSNQFLEVRPDEDGENRILEIELGLNYRIKFYEDEQFRYLKDAYSTSCTLELERREVDTKKLLMKNQSILRIADRIRIEQENQPVLQICNATGTVKIDEQTITTEGIQLEGIVDLDILYITENDDSPLAMMKGTLPFTHLIEIKGISPDDDYELQTQVSQINVMMLDSQEIEAKVILNLCAFVFVHDKEKIITDITEKPLDMERLQEMPGLVGYIAEEPGSLWNIAKAYNTTVEDIMKLNGLERDYVNTGDRLLFVKQIDGI